MTKLDELMQATYAAQEVLDAAIGERNLFLDPILQELGAKGGDISYVQKDETALYVERSGSCRGCGWTDDYKFPLSIFYSKDPISEARNYTVREKEKKEADARSKKLRQLEALKKELGA